MLTRLILCVPEENNSPLFIGFWQESDRCHRDRYLTREKSTPDSCYVNRNQIVFTSFQLIWNMRTENYSVIKQWKSGKYNLISVDLTKIESRFLFPYCDLSYEPSVKYLLSLTSDTCHPDKCCQELTHATRTNVVSN